MKLRQKTILIIIITLISLIGAFYLASSAILLESIRSSEHREAEQHVIGFRKLFSYTLRNFSELFRDWSHWDDAYQFIKDANQEFIDEQLKLETLKGLKLDMMLFVKNSGKLVHGIGFGKEKLTLETLPAILRKQLVEGNEFLHHQNVQSIKMGLLQLSTDYPFWIVSLPIVTTQGNGPILGNLIVGRVLHDLFWQKISGVANFPLEYYQVNPTGRLPHKIKELLPRLSQSILILPRNEESLYGYSLLKDIYQKPALVVKLILPRDAYLRGKESMFYLTMSLLISGLVFMLVTLSSLERWVLQRLDSLARQVNTITQQSSVSLRVHLQGNDEFSVLAETINRMLGTLYQAEQDILMLNERLKADNLRMRAELEVTHRLQQMLLPKAKELSMITELDIAGFMEPATEVGGDYYDVLQHDGRLMFGIGDVTGHGLESGVLMLMVQMAVRILLTSNMTEPKIFLTVLNRAVYENIQRMNCDKTLSLALLEYQDGKLRLSGQHETILVIRQGGEVEKIDTLDLGLPIGLEENISDFIGYKEFFLSVGEGIVLYTDGVTEAENSAHELYGLERLCAVIHEHWDCSALEIQRAVVKDVHRHIGTQEIFDDITLVVLKRKDLLSKPKTLSV